MMNDFSKQNARLEKRAFFEFDYFRPDSNNLLHPIFNQSLLLFFLAVGVAGVGLTIFYPPLGLSLPFVANRALRKARLHDLQTRYMTSGVIPPQNGSSYGGDESKYWDCIELRHRHRDNGWA